MQMMTKTYKTILDLKFTCRICGIRLSFLNTIKKGNVKAQEQCGANFSNENCGRCLIISKEGEQVAIDQKALVEKSQELPSPMVVVKVSKLNPKTGSLVIDGGINKGFKNFIKDWNPFWPYNGKRFSMIVPTRSDYGGRNSQLCASLPLWVFCLWISLIYFFHACHFMSNIWLIWLFLGMNFMVNEWIRVGMLESTYQNTISAKINTEGSMSLLLIFEACFFAGVYWIYGLGRVHGMPEVSLRSATAGNDLSIFGSYESNPMNILFNTFEDVKSFIVIAFNYCVNFIGANLSSIYLNLGFLLVVTLGVQYAHRKAIYMTILKFKVESKQLAIQKALI
jgi:hypothetical protein